MSKRIIYQCDRCSKTREQEDQPSDWASITAAFSENQRLAYQAPSEYRLWCDGCWRELKKAVPQAVAA